MFKKELGISIYPEKSNLETITQYLIKAKKCGFTKLFMAWFQLIINNSIDKYLELYQNTIKKAKELGFYVVLDINDNNFKFYQSLGVDCVRMDAPSWPLEVANFTQATDFDFQINMSGESNYLESVLMCDPVIENLAGCHNFYPQIYTGLTWNDFIKWTKYFTQFGIRTATFINSQHGLSGPQNFELNNGVVTVEELRFLPIRTQAKLMFATKLIDDVYIGNQFASGAELESLIGLDTKKIELDIEIVRELQAIEFDILQINHCRRGDINESFIRSTENRVHFKDSVDVEIEMTTHYFHKGDVVIVNKSDRNYQRELHLVLKDIELANAQLVAKVKDYDFSLIDLISAGRWFKFRVLN